jgi:hypothetical protein
MFEHDVGQAIEIFVEQPRDGFRRHRVAELRKSFEVGEDTENIAPLAVERELVGVAHDLRGDVGGQIFAKRRLRKGALARPDRACGGADRGVTEQPADRPAEGRQRRRVDAASLQPEREGDEKGHLPEEGERDPARAQVDEARQPARKNDQHREHPKRRRGDRPRPCLVELLRQHMRVDLEPDHRFMLAGDRVGKAAERRVELVVVDDVAADQDIAPFDQLRKTGAHLGIHRHREGVDRDVGEDGFLLPRRGARGDEEADIALEIRMRRVDGSHRIGHQGRQILRPVGPVADHAVVIGAKQHACRLRLRGRDVGDIGLEEFLLFVEDRVRVARLFGIGEPGRGLHRAQLRLQQIVVGARRVEGNIDADRFRAHLVEIAERIGEQSTVERRADARVEQSLVIIGDERDAFILFDMRRHQCRARVVKCALGCVDQRHLPAETGDQYCDQEEDDCRRHPRRA